MGKIDRDFWQNKKVFLTGHTGFKGSWMLFWLLELGSEVCGYSLKPENQSLFNTLFLNKKNYFENYYGDIKDKKNLNKIIEKFQPDIIFHFAAQPLVLESYKDPLNTWETNLIGTLNLLECLKKHQKKCSIVLITTDKVYKNKEWEYGYRENDEIGGHDPYSASKAATELLIQSWRDSFVGLEKHQNINLHIASARSGNVIGGGDWSENRIIPDVINSLVSSKSIYLRSPHSKRPWQHVLEPLRGYLLLAEKLYEDKFFSEAFNFGPSVESNKEVQELVEEVLKYWPGNIAHSNNYKNFYESKILYLQIEKSYKLLNWQPIWDFKTTVDRTVSWYKGYYEGINPIELCRDNLINFYKDIHD